MPDDVAAKRAMADARRRTAGSCRTLSAPPQQSLCHDASMSSASSIKSTGTGYRGRVGEALRGYLLRLWLDADADYRDQIVRLVARAHPSDILDLGCDDGAFTARLVEAVGSPKRVAGLEIVETARRRAEARGIETVVGDLNAPLSFEDAAFDLVHANQVIEHVVSLDRFVEEIGRVLRPGGAAVICTENLASWHNIAALAAGFMPFSLTNISTRGAIGNPFALAETPADELEPSWFHTRVLSAQGLEDIFRKHGFEIVERFGAGYHPLPGPLARHMARWDPRHAAFIGVVAKKPPTAASPGASSAPA
jgi:SAM-dependent methyltransferase